MVFLCFRPYITHNYIVSHVHFLRKVNDEEGRPYNVCRILPVGGTFNTRGDVLALLVWYLMLVYAALAIPVSRLRSLCWRRLGCKFKIDYENVQVYLFLNPCITAVICLK